ncbi:MAG: N-acetylmuramoyl-L-alanine amidase [Pseudorhodoplanes sp.]|nr:N-acetylmuramoyl-L-alanine amidase [Pseudorhodoplanes sp.]
MAGRWACSTLSIAALVAGLAGPGMLARAQVFDSLPIATDARLAGDDKETRLIVDLTRKMDVRAFTLSNPYRVVVDLPQTVFQLPSKAGETGRGLIKAFRYGLVMAGGSRIVVDVTKPVRLDRLHVLEAREGQPARLVLDLAATDRESFMRNMVQQARALPLSDPRKTDAAMPRPAGDPRPLIVIDPGHGGPDTGAKVADGEIMEKHMVLDFSITLRDQLEKSGKYRVVMTRTDDTFIPLAERVKIARQRQASLFISIHADSLPKAEGDAQGATIYTLSDKPSDSDAAKLAEEENRSDVVAGIDLSREPGDVADILIDLAQRETKGYSHHFARTLVGEMKTAMRLHKKPLKSASFVVLKAPDVPSVLVELGYMTNKQDLKLLVSENWRTKAADSMVQAVDAFFRTRIAGADASAARR